ncbi:hypothetical protein LIX87_02410 [Weissella viridescens]|uniref:hypothetical protein n=1 Tax=Weissella viridescens TaxID=1629 RepID=UPI001D06DAF2|nr:hypothetical protein [Weissella viridescens]MCB6839873.1 hypothetical protein [Weissella viridescens]MCB6846605.1 hypothetical protein [Weissella viridescens]
MINDLEFDIQFTRFVDDYRFYAKKNSDLTEFRHHLTKIFRKYELSFNDTKSQIYKGFEIQKQARDDIFSKLKFLDNKNENLTFEKYLKLRDVIITLLDQNEISTIKSVLSILEKKITAKKITFTEDNIVTSFLRFLIKLAYVQPMLASRIYSVINEMLKVVVPKIRHEAWEVLFEELEYIELNYAETDLEFWFFFVLVNAGVSAETGRAFSLYKTLAKSNVNVIVLTIFIKEKSKKTNLKVYNELLKQMTDLSPKDKSEFLGTIGQSKWWILLTKMWLVMENEITDSEIIDLFKTKKNQIQWDKMGIVEFLKRQNKVI